MNNPIQKWHDVVKLRDYNTLTEIIHDEAIFYSPVVYTPQKGKIILDGQEINKVSLKSLRDKISLVSQDVILFDDSVENNIKYAGNVISGKHDVYANSRTVNSLFETALEENEIVVSVEFNIPKKSSYMKFPNPASRYAMAGVYVSVFDDAVNVAVTGASENGVFKWTEMEEALSSNLSLENAKNIKLSSDGVMSDIHADSAYRANLVDIMALRAVENLI